MPQKEPNLARLLMVALGGFALTSSALCLAQGFGGDAAQQRLNFEREKQELATLVGNRYWLNFGNSSSCLGKVFPAPGRSGQGHYQSSVPVQVEVMDVARDDYQFWYKLLVNGKDIGYMRALEFRPQSTSERALLLECVLSQDPDEAKQAVAAIKAAQASSMAEQDAKVQAAIAAAGQQERRLQQATAAQAKKPGAAIGMTAKHVLERTNWGRPTKVNRTITAEGTHEQWVYGSGSYLYFRNGVLYAIQN